MKGVISVNKVKVEDTIREAVGDDLVAREDGRYGTRHIKKGETYHAPRNWLDSFDGADPVRAAAILQEALAMVPTIATEVRWRADTDYPQWSETAIPVLYLEYTRPMNEKEIARRDAYAAAQKAAQEDRDREIFERLKKKFG